MMKRSGIFVAIFAVLAMTLSALGFTAVAQHGHGGHGMGMGTPGAGMMADCPYGTPGAGMGHGNMGDCPYGTPGAGTCPFGTPGAGMGPGMMGTCPYGTPASGMPGMNASTSMGAFYLTVTNNGDEADVLLAAKSDVAEFVQVHDVVMDGNVMNMVEQKDGVEIPAGGELVLEPGSYHIMMIGLHESLLAGNEFTATLVFEKAGEVEITVPVLATEPKEGDLTAEPVEAGDLVIDGIWARQAPKLDGATGTTEASPAPLQCESTPQAQSGGSSCTIPGLAESTPED